MAHHKSSLKRIRSDRKKAARNRYQHKTTRNAVRALRATTDAKEAAKMLPSGILHVGQVGEEQRDPQEQSIQPQIQPSRSRSEAVIDVDIEFN